MVAGHGRGYHELSHRDSVQGGGRHDATFSDETIS